MSAAPAVTNAMIVVISMTSISFPDRLRRAWRMDSRARQGRLPDSLEARFMSCLHIGIGEIRNRFSPTGAGE
jgi:hypothetical protein